MSAQNMALFLYGFDVTGNNQNLDFNIGGSQLTAVLTKGNYTSTAFLAMVAAAMGAVEPTSTYTLSIDRSTSGGLSNRVTITSTAATFQLLFSSGTNSGASPASLLGFAALDSTGATSYVGVSNCGTILYPDYATYNYIGPNDYIVNDGIRSISANGTKEALIFAQFGFMQGQWMYINNLNGNTQLTQWEAFMSYITKQLFFEFTPSVSESTSTFYQCTLESTPEDKANGIMFTFKLMMNQRLFRFYDTGLLTFRKVAGT